MSISIKSEPISLAHKELLYNRLRGIHSQVSEYSFANAYLFRRVHNYEVIRAGDEVFLQGQSYDKKSYIQPTCDLNDIDMSLLLELMGQVDFLYPVPENRMHYFPPEMFSHEFLDGDSDYVYTADKMRNYPGRRLHRKRNLLKQFTSNYRHEAVPLTTDRLVDAEFILNDWLKTSGHAREDTDYLPCLDGIKHYEELVLCGCIYYAEGEPAGFVIGEELSPGMFVLHFAKARVKFKGVYQYIFNDFANILPATYKLINLEQDLDKEALRVAKSSYQPDVMIKKARVRLV